MHPERTFLFPLRLNFTNNSAHKYDPTGRVSSFRTAKCADQAKGLQKRFRSLNPHVRWRILAHQPDAPTDLCDQI